jgi:probable O-glycosylation ligase (exosortase A-associated)
MVENLKQESSVEPAGSFTTTTPRITGNHLVMLAVMVLSVFMGVALLVVPDGLQMVLILILPASLFCFMILRKPYVGVYLFFLYAFLRPYDFIPALLPLRLAMVIEIVTLAAWIIALVREKGKVNWSAFNWLYVGFVAMVVLSIITAVHQRRAYDIFMEIIVYFLMLTLATNIARTMGQLKKLIWLLLLIHGYFAIRGIYNLFLAPGFSAPTGGGTSGVVGTSFLADENDFALALNVMIPFAFFMFEHYRNKIKSLIAGALMVLYSLGVVARFSRGGLVGLAVVVGYCVMFSKRKMIAVAAVVVMLLAMVAFAPSSYWEEAQTIGDTSEDTAMQRLQYWTAAFRMFVDHPIIGVGAGNGGIHLPDYMSYLENPGRQWGRAFHGTIPQVAAELGLVGLCCYLGMLVIMIKSLARIRRKTAGETGDLPPPILARAITGSILAYFVTATFLSTVYYPQLWTLYTFGLILVYNVNESDKRREPQVL